LCGIARNFLKFKVGNGKHIHLWLDNWHPFGLLYEKYGFRIIYDSQSNLDAKLNSVLINVDWRWKQARPEALVDIQSRLPNVHLSVVDKPIWAITRKCVYVIADTWNHMRKKQEVRWWPLI
jgi:hypothetical protein